MGMCCLYQHGDVSQLHIPEVPANHRIRNVHVMQTSHNICRQSEKAGGHFVVMNDPSSPMDVCPFCGKAFKRLKSHLPHCKMAEAKKPTLETDSGDRSMTATLVSRKRTGTIAQNQDPKVKGKSKTEGLKSQGRQDKTTQGKVGKVTSGSRLPQQKAAVTIEHSQKAPQTRTKDVVTSAKERGQDQEALTDPRAPIQQALILRPRLEMAGPAPRMSNTLQTVRDQVKAENSEGDQGRLLAPKWISEEDTEGSSVGVQDHVQDPFHDQAHLGQSSVPRSLSGSTNGVMVFGWSTSFPQQRVKTPMPGISPTVCNVDVDLADITALGTIGKSTETKMDVLSMETKMDVLSMETKMDVLSPSKTVPTGLLPPVDGPLGLQWVPEFYNNYVQLCVVPGRQDQWDPHGRGTKTLEPRGGQPERCKTVYKDPVVENQSASKPLMDVRLGELPAWFASRRYSPKRIPESIENAWGRYYNKYINVRKGGVGGLTMLLAGYCVLSYTWNYDHIKRDRWRKYH